MAADRITDAAETVATARAVRPRESEPVTQAKIDLHHGVDDARDGGMTWGTIGDLLEISRGAAIKRYRHPGQRNSTDHTLPVGAAARFGDLAL